MSLYDISGNELVSGGSPIQGKRIAFIGDSNTQYSSETLKEYMDSTYGCVFTPLGYAGATWETTAGADATDNNGVGRVNRLILNADSNNLLTEYDYFIFMLGTNCGTLGALDDTSDDVSTMCGAMKYCMEKMCYYGRRATIGVIIPFRNALHTDAELPEKFSYIKQIAAEYSVPVLDLYTEGRILPDSKTPDGSTYYLADEVHLGGNGRIQVEHRIGKWIAYRL